MAPIAPPPPPPTSAKPATTTAQSAATATPSSTAPNTTPQPSTNSANPPATNPEPAPTPATTVPLTEPVNFSAENPAAATASLNIEAAEKETSTQENSETQKTDPAPKAEFPIPEKNTEAAESETNPENPTTKTEEEPKKAAPTNAKDPAKPLSPFAKLRKRLSETWEVHVQKNKSRQEEREQNTDSPDPKGKFSAKNKKVSQRSKEELLETYEPLKDRQKLTKEQKAAIIESEKWYRQGVITIRDSIAPSSVEVTPKSIQINDQWSRTFFLYNYPRYLNVNWLSNVINFDNKLDISLHIYPQSSDKILRILRKKVTEMLSSKHINEKKGVVGDVALDTALEDAEQLRVDLQRGLERFFQLGVYFTIYADSAEELKKTTERIQTIFGGQLIMTRPADFQAERGFNSTLPQGTDELNITRNMNTSPLSTTFPFVSSDLTSEDGILYGVNRHNNSLVIFDRFQLENANSTVFAKSGAGKSYTVKLEILRSLMTGSDVIIIDPENEYENLIKAVDGQYVRISLNSPHRINPFDLPLPIKDEPYKTSEAIRESIINVTGLIKVMLGSISAEEDGILDQALRQVYEIKGITDNTEEAYTYEMPIMADLQKVLESMNGGANLAMRLERFTKGTMSGLFAGQSNVDLSKGALCFCIRDLEEMMRPVAMYVLLNFIWGRVRSELKRRLLIIDEAWNLVQHEDSGRFLHNLVKRARKYYLGISTITQDVEDFLGSQWGKPIITNSSLQILLKQAPAAVEKLQDIFHLTDGEKYLLMNSDVGQGLFFAGNQHVAIQIIANEDEHRLVTTNPMEKA